MKIVKAVINGILVILILMCAFVLVCAFNPSLTNTLKEKVAANSTTESDSAQSSQKPQNKDTGYVAPSQDEVASPEAVQGRNGYQPIAENGEQIADEDAQILQGELQPGEIGEEYSFDGEMYPYYNMLDGTLQTLYRQIYANALNLNASFAPVMDVTVDQATKTFEAVYNDHPELFWLDSGYSCKYLRSGKCIEITIAYNATSTRLDAAKAEFDSEAQAILVGAGNLGTDSEKEKYVHDALMQQVEYDTSAAMNQSAYSAMVNGKSVCAGYARAFQYLMMKLGVPCYYCTGYSGENHAWNIIKIDGKYYNVDVTWDDTDPSTYDYYNKSDREYANTHMRTSLSVYLPACTDDNSADNGMGNNTNNGAVEIVNPDDGTPTESSDSLINDNPQKPLTWSDYVAENNGTGSQDETQDSSLERAGLTADMVMNTLDEYYADCLEQMKKAGTGQQQFVNVIPASLWPTVEKVYSDGSYWNGYVNAALKELGMQNFAIQLQAERLDGGYYRLYHNISTWQQ